MKRIKYNKVLRERFLEKTSKIIRNYLEVNFRNHNLG